jgi:predicted acetyltransferase
MNVTGIGALDVRHATAADRPALARMLELYQHDLSDLWHQELDANGEFGYALDRYWQDPDCHPFVALVDGYYAGFALVDAAVKVGPSGHWMDQFFVLKKHRRAGVGRAIALHVFAALPGDWEVGQMTGNLPAQVFWRRVIAERTEGNYAEHELTGGGWHGVVQCFRCTA